MAVSFVKVKRNVTLGSNPGEKFVVRLYRGTDVQLEQIAEDIANQTTISFADTIAVLKSLEVNISKYVVSGQAVKLGYLGSFIPQISAKAMETAEEADVSSIHRFSCRFLPSVEFKRTLKKVKFKQSDFEVKGLVE